MAVYHLITEALEDVASILGQASKNVGAIVVKRRLGEDYMPVIGMPYILEGEAVSEYTSLDFLTKAAESHNHQVVAVFATIR